MSTPPDQAAQALDKILDNIKTRELVSDNGESRIYKTIELTEEGKAEVKADLLTLMYRETLAVIGEDDLPEIGLEREWKNGLRAMQRQAAAKRYGQIRSEE